MRLSRIIALATAAALAATATPALVSAVDLEISGGMCTITLTEEDLEAFVHPVYGNSYFTDNPVFTISIEGAASNLPQIEATQKQLQNSLETTRNAIRIAEASGVAIQRSVLEAQEKLVAANQSLLEAYEGCATGDAPQVTEVSTPSTTPAATPTESATPTTPVATPTSEATPTPTTEVAETPTPEVTTTTEAVTTTETSTESVTVVTAEQNLSADLANPDAGSNYATFGIAGVIIAILAALGGLAFAVNEGLLPFALF